MGGWGGGGGERERETIWRGGGGGGGERERDNLARSLMLYFLFLDSCLYSVLSFIRIVRIVCPNILDDAF